MAYSTEDTYHGKDCAEQLYKDAIINATAMEGGWGRVRLHWADEEDAWRETILSALEHQLEYNKGFVCWSPSYSMGILH